MKNELKIISTIFMTFLAILLNWLVWFMAFDYVGVDFTQSTAVATFMSLFFFIAIISSMNK